MQYFIFCHFGGLEENVSEDFRYFKGPSCKLLVGLQPLLKTLTP